MRIIHLIVLLDIIGFGIILPIFPFFAARLGAGPELIMVFLALYMAVAFLPAPILGRWSDRFGRKPVIAVSLLGAAVGLCVSAFVLLLLFVEESNPQGTASKNEALSFASLGSTFRSIRVRPTLLTVLFCGLLYNFSSGLYETIVPLWAEQLGVIKGPKGLLPMLLASGVAFIVVQAKRLNFSGCKLSGGKAVLMAAGTSCIQTGQTWACRHSLLPSPVKYARHLAA